MNLEDIVFLSEKKFINKNPFIVDWQIGIFCNYSCSYCFPMHHSKIYDFNSISHNIKIIDKIVKYSVQEKFDYIDLWIAGGEITAYKNIDTLFKYMNDIQLIDIHLNIMTNLSPSMNYWKKFIDITNKMKINLIASFHIEYANPKEFIEKCLYINSHADFFIKIVVSPKLFERIKEASFLFDDSKLKVHYGYERKDNHQISSEYTKEMLNFIDTKNKNLEDKLVIRSNHEEKEIFSGDYFIDKKFQDFRGWNCIAGKNSIFIDKNGNVRRCISSKNENLGNIAGNFKPTTNKCVTEKCKCIGDLHLTKWKD